MHLKVYEYSNCGTCRKAVKFLTEHGINFELKPIRTCPPTKQELRAMLRVYSGDIRRLFNTSGQDYRALNLKETLPALSEDQAIDLLSKTGNLVKRPFVTFEGGGLVGFKEEEWRERLLKS
jgi:arsenate reductase (glutaredoxin)